MKDILVIGHRGAKGHLAENTIESFQKAVELGSDGIEFDIRCTSDGIPVVFHDETLLRTTGSGGNIKDHTAADLSNVFVDGKYGIPTLGEVLNWAGEDLLLNIEIKSDDALTAVENLVTNSIRNGRRSAAFLVSSFNWNILQELRRRNPEIPTGVITSTDLELAAGFARFIGAESIHPHFHLLTRENCMRLKSDGLKIMTWTVNHPEDIELMKYFEVDGIITDYPDRV